MVNREVKIGDLLAPTTEVNDGVQGSEIKSKKEAYYYSNLIDVSSVYKIG